MIDELIDKLQPLVEAETERISKKHGDKYTSAHEVESVLLEEEHFLLKSVEAIIAEHSTSEIKSLEDAHVKCMTSESVELIKQYALNAAAEAVQVAAVCEKIARGV